MDIRKISPHIAISRYLKEHLEIHFFLAILAIQTPNFFYVKHLPKLQNVFQQWEKNLYLLRKG